MNEEILDELVAELAEEYSGQTVALNEQFVVVCAGDLPYVLSEVEKRGLKEEVVLLNVPTAPTAPTISTKNPWDIFIGPCPHGRDPWDRCEHCVEVVDEAYHDLVALGCPRNTNVDSIIARAIAKAIKISS